MVSWPLDMSVRDRRLQKRNIMREGVGEERGNIRIVTAYADDFAAIGFDGCHC